MLPDIKLEISLNDKVVQTVTKQISEQGLVKSLEDFLVVANATMTKLINDSGDSGDSILEEDGDDSENEEVNVPVTPKKRRK